MPGFENEYLEAAGVAEKGDAGWHIQTRSEYRGRESRWKVDGWRQRRIEVRGVVHALRRSRRVCNHIVGGRR